MSVKNILVPVREDNQSENNLWHAAAIAKTQEAHIEVLHCRASASDMIPYGIVVPLALRKQITQQAAKLADSDQTELVRQFKEQLCELGLTQTEGQSTEPLTASWREEEGKMAELIGPWGRLCDLVVVSRPERDRNIGLRTLMSALYECGRPVMMCPPKDLRKDTVGNRIAIAWNGSLQATRAVAQSLDLLKAAEDIVILAGETAHPANSAEALSRYLALCNINATVEKIKARTRPGQVILDAASSASADTLVMGAYSHSRERELVFGGATQYIVDHANLSVVFAH